MIGEEWLGIEEGWEEVKIKIRFSSNSLFRNHFAIILVIPSQVANNRGDARRLEDQPNSVERSRCRQEEIDRKENRKEH